MTWSDWIEHPSDAYGPDLVPRTILEVEVASGQRYLVAESNFLGVACDCCCDFGWRRNPKDPIRGGMVLRYRTLKVPE